jgi:hypothetical protein
MSHTPPNQVADTGVIPSLSMGNLAIYELQKPFVEPMLRMCRLTNTALDILFYDVGALTTALLAKGRTVDTAASADLVLAPHPLESLDLSALTNPSGSVIVVDANLAPYVRPPFRQMDQFFAHANGPEGAGLHTIAITGVGSSAFGSVAFAWDISAALGEPVAAVVPGYGLADLVPQALGGWFGFEMYGALQTAAQDFLAHFAPVLALMGKELARTTPGHALASTGAPVFRHGSAASDDVHAVLQHVPGITRLIGHSKGALAIENALRSLSAERTEKLSVLTFGCVVSEELAHRNYTQYLGWIDALGFLNSSGNEPESRPVTHHSTNTFIPLSMPVAEFVTRAMAGREGAVGKIAGAIGASSIATEGDFAHPERRPI